MKTNLTAVKENFEQTFSNELYNDVEVKIDINDKKANQGSASITVSITGNEGKKVCGTIYIVEREKTIITLFVNDITHDVVFNNASAESVDKAQKYVNQYFERSTKKLLGIEITDGSQPKRPYKNNGKKNNKKQNKVTNEK